MVFYKVDLKINFDKASFHTIMKRTSIQEIFEF